MTLVVRGWVYNFECEIDFGCMTLKLDFGCEILGVRFWVCDFGYVTLDM